MDKDVSNLIERLEPFEERLGVRLEGLSAVMDQWCSRLDSSVNWIQVNVRGELHTNKGITLNQNTAVVVTIYDNSGRVIATTDQSYLANKFYAFEVFDLALNLGAPPPPKIAKIRVHPKEW